MLTFDSQQLARVCKDYELDLVILFGSHAKGYATPGSDYDIAVLPSKAPVPPEEVLTLAFVLSRALGVREIDLVDLRRASPLLKHQAAESGKVLYEREEGTFTRFRVLAYKLYQDASYGLHRFLPESIERALEKLRR
ncbi:MAG: nucleotidyltransferase domain-containing protein [Chloroflexi bacterium]|nr:nucleotidyltransferase domain-containing protein [Chloroflexota bacterium]